MCKVKGIGCVLTLKRNLRQNTGCCVDQVKEESDLLCVVLEELKLVKSQAKQGRSSNKRQPALDGSVLNGTELLGTAGTYEKDAKTGLLIPNGDFLCLGLFVCFKTKLQLDFIQISLIFKLFFFSSFRFSLGSYIAFSCYFFLVSSHLTVPSSCLKVLAKFRSIKRQNYSKLNYRSNWLLFVIHQSGSLPPFYKIE